MVIADVRGVLLDFARHEVLDLVDTFVLSYEHGSMKPDPTFFRIACDAIAVDPAEVVMVGDSLEADGGATATGCHFAHVGSPRGERSLLRTLGLLA